ncbi:MAG: hypothetical protein ABH842_01925 [Candidatus Micrarchaeota archaeon]
MEDEQVITKIKDSHCTIGPDSCLKCKEAEIQGERFMLLSLELRFAQTGEVIAQPLAHLMIDGKPTYTGYVIKKIFDDESEARKYSQEHKIKIVEKVK